jgi:3-isopropylmalate dehydratase small subunit
VSFPKVLRGKAWKFGANIDTDQIIPAKYAIYSLDERKLGEHVMEGVPGNENGWSQQISAGDILVAGFNFGCGSSREIAPVAIRGAGVAAVIADSYARIYFRNSINLAFPALTSAAAAEAIKEGDELEIDLEVGVIRNFTQGDEYRSDAYPPFMTELIKMGGLVPWVRKRLEERRRVAASRG